MDYNFTAKDIAFFDQTEPFGWGTKTTDYKAINLECFRQEAGYSRKNTRWLRDHCGTLTALLSKAVKDELGQDPCCDSWSDTLNHIVGLGRHEFMRNLYEPQKIVDRAEAGDYKESFGYALPYAEDYDKCELHTHQLTAARYLGQLTAEILLEGIEDNTPEEQAALATVQHSFALLTTGKVKEYLATREAVLAIVKDDDLRNLIGLHHGPDNVFTNVDTFKEFFQDF